MSRQLVARSFPRIIDTKATSAARIFWIVSHARRLCLLDDDAVELWCMGQMSDYDLVETIATHGGFRDYQSPRHSLHEDAQLLAFMCAEFV